MRNHPMLTFFANMVKNKMELNIDLIKCKILYMQEDGNHKLLQVESVEKCLNENGDEVDIVYLQDKGRKE